MNENQQTLEQKDGPLPALRVATGYRPLSADKVHALKEPMCPYCGGKLRFSINGCEIDEATGWIATDLDINCDTEPDIDGPEWEDWWREHSWDCCDKWHDIHDRIVASLKRTHRVLHDNKPSGEPPTGRL